MNESHLKSLAFILILLFWSGCNLQDEPSLFKKLNPSETGVDFNNVISSSDSLNIQNYPFMFNGGGVAIGDINNDGLPDLFFTGNMVSSRLYLNKGDMEFEDITESAGVQTDRWASGVSMVDINADGFLDIYVSVVSPEDSDPEERANMLFINNGDTTFTEKASEYNIDFTGFTTHSAFLDYDRDGDLDLFLLNHSPGSFARNQGARKPSPLFGMTNTSYDELFRNNGDGTFTRVTKEAGLLRQEGFGLGVAVSDINRDGWPDIYVSNDILPDDVLYINNGDGTFSDRTEDFLKHTSFAGMGVDIADFNNDGWPDIFQVDMMPEKLEERKLMSGGISYNHYQDMREQGFYYQHSLNTLQLSNGINEDGNLVFSEIGRLAGVAYTDWSWSALFGDYDNDGLKDLMVTNGFPKAINNYDYLTDMNEAIQFGNEQARQERRREILENLRSLKVPNYLFKNNGDLTFSDKSETWGFDEAVYAFGASQADLDNDGDLDIVINNINSPASLYKNKTDTLRDHHYLTVKLNGSSSNTGGIGAQINISAGGTQQYQYFSPYGGYQSTTGSRIHFGLKENQQIDSLEVLWPDGSRQILKNIQADQEITLNYTDAERSTNSNESEYLVKDRLFTELSNRLGIDYQHLENSYNDYKIQGLLPYQLSKLGPPIAKGDVNADGREDVFIGGASGQPAELYIQTAEGSFRKSEENNPWVSDKRFEDLGCVFFDADNDGDQDLYVASGGYEFSPASDMLQDRLYLNNGDGTFVRNESLLPRILTSSSVVKPGDFDSDGDTDLFVGGRMVPRRYPFPAKSFLLRNDNGNFKDVTSQLAPDLVEAGMITDAVWSDFNGDGQLDLVTTGEWMPVRFFKNENGSFTDVTDSKISSQKGWWFSIEKGDFDDDGDPDFVVGNLGLNYGYKTNKDQKFEVFVSDFDKNSSLDLIFSIEQNGTHYPYYGKAKLGMKIPSINKKFLTYQEFSEATVEDVVGTQPAEEAFHLQADSFASIYLENNGEEGFSVTQLPIEAQMSSINEIKVTDIDNDDNLDLILAGNMYHTEPQTARNDAGNGLVLKGNGNGDFNAISPFESGFLAPLMVSDLEIIETVRGRMVIVANNDNELQVFNLME